MSAVSTSAVWHSQHFAARHRRSSPCQSPPSPVHLNKPNRSGGLSLDARVNLRCRGRRQPVSTAAAGTGSAAAEEALREWIEAHGGFVHPALELTDHTPSGVRGVIARDTISLQEVEDAPLVIVPTALYLSTDDLGTVTRALTGDSARQTAFEELSKEQQLALLLAHERSQESASFYAPYINSLPAQPPCAWLMEEEELQAALAELGCAAEEQGRLKLVVKHACSSVSQLCNELADLYGQQLAITAEDLRWAVGHIVSRSFGNSSEGIGMAPYIDLMNHHQDAIHPIGHAADDQDPVVYVPSVMNGEPRALHAGDEVFISYITGKTGDQLAQVFLSFGFVPNELRPQPAVSANLL